MKNSRLLGDFEQYMLEQHMLFYAYITYLLYYVHKERGKCLNMRFITSIIIVCVFTCGMCNS